MQTATGADVSTEPGAGLLATILTMIDVCRYPDVFKYIHRDLVRQEMPSPRQVARLVDTLTVYTPDDMQLFHHYLISAYPCIPHDFEEIWTKDVPKMSHKVST